MLKKEKLSQRKTSLIIGITLYIMAVCSGFAYGVVHSSLIVNGDAAATTKNILRSFSLFRTEIFVWMIILAGDLIVAWGLYIYLRGVDKSLSLLAAFLRAVYCLFLGIAIVNLYDLLQWFSLRVSSDQLQNQVLVHINAFNNLWFLGLIIFGFHLLVVGYLVIRSTFVPRFLGILLLMASVCYIFIYSSHVFLPHLEATMVFEKILSLPMAAGELGFGLWLLLKGGKIPKMSS